MKKIACLLGFRSNKLWKKIVSVIYLAVVGLCSVSMLFSSGSGAEFASNFVGCLLMISPYIFLSNTRLRDSLPLFRAHKAGKSFLGMVIVVLILAICMGAVPSPDVPTPDVKSETANSQEDDSVSKDKKEKDKDSVASGNSKIDEIITDKVLLSNFINACKEIGIDLSDIKNFKKVDDWTGGERYSFSYEGLRLRLYCNMDSSVASIKLGVDTDLYKDGYEPYQISDYFIDSGLAYNLQSITTEKVKEKLNFPSTADFKLLDWSFFRECDVYSLSSSVEAKNAFGVKSEVPFHAKYYVANDSAKLIYFSLDGYIYTDKTADYALPERKTVKSKQKRVEDALITADMIFLNDGELGDYGKVEVIDGSEYINYYIPAGKYTVTNKGKKGVVFVAKNEYYTNSNGYTENEIVDTINLTENDEIATLTVKEGEHLELSLNTKVVLKKK